MMPPEVAEALIGALNTAVTAVVSATAMWCVTKVRQVVNRSAEDRRKDRQKQEVWGKALLALLHSELAKAHEEYVERGRVISLDRRRDLDSVYDSYHELGGNGTGTDMYERICEVEISTSCPLPRGRSACHVDPEE